MTIVSDEIQHGINRIEDTEVPVIDIFDAVEKHNVKPKQVAQDFGLTEEEVYEALQYYEQHPEEMKEDRRISKQMTKKNKLR